MCHGSHRCCAGCCRQRVVLVGQPPFKVCGGTCVGNLLQPLAAVYKVYQAHPIAVTASNTTLHDVFG